MTCKGYKTKCFYHTPRTKNTQQCIHYNRQTKKCEITKITINNPYNI